jgi:hypothetical protein
MKLSVGPLEPWLHPNGQWTRADQRAWCRAKETGHITDDMADRLLIRYASLQLEVIHPDYNP